jgi:hypothetical protein
MKPFLSLVFVLMAANSGAETYAVGDRIEPFALEDQHGEPHRIDEAVAVVLFGREMSAARVVKAALEHADADALKSRRVVYVADIEGMPRLVAKLFALPSMRRRPYPILLDREGVATERFPGITGAVTVLYLDRLEITRVEQLSDPAEVRRAALGE